MENLKRVTVINIKHIIIFLTLRKAHIHMHYILKELLLALHILQQTYVHEHEAEYANEDD